MADTKSGTSPQPTKEIIGTTVHLEMESPERYIGETPVTVQLSGGSGFFVERDKIVTNFHVVEGATRITAKRIDPETIYTIEGIIAFDVENDLVILKIAEKDTPFMLGNSEIARKGDQISAVGYLGNRGSSVEGTVRGTRSGDHWLRIKALLKPGWSGCPVLNSKGEVIAVHSGGSIVPNTCYAVPSNTLKALLNAAKRTEAEPLHKWQEHPRVLAALEHQKGKAKKKGGDYKGAIAAYDNAIKLSPDIADAYESRGEIKIRLGDPVGAFDDLYTSLRLHQKQFRFSDFGSFCSLMLMFVFLFVSKSLVKLTRTIIGSRSWLVVQGTSKTREAKSKADQNDKAEAKFLYQKAINDYTGAINLKPKKGNTYNSRGWTKYLLGQLETQQGNTAEAQNLYREAISDVDEALQLKPKGKRYRSAFYHTRGAAKACLGDYNGAIEDFSESIQLNPKKALYYHDRGLAKEVIGQHEAARADFAKAKEIDPDFEK
ncbi:tetratricopeptide repeat protein [Candidatus Poribacteria bacterium]|nr:tetratricopeptide repeat protein [Candidatus Poribacteria bacterium]